MITPNKESISYVLGHHLYRNGPQTLETIDECFRGNRTGRYKTSLNRMLKSGLVYECDGKIYLSREMQAHYKDISKKSRNKNLVPSAEPPVFKPWTGKYNISASAPRNDAENRPEHSIFSSGTAPDPLTGMSS